MQRSCADMNSPYKRKCWTNSPALYLIHYSVRVTVHCFCGRNKILPRNFVPKFSIFAKKCLISYLFFADICFEGWRNKPPGPEIFAKTNVCFSENPNKPSCNFRSNTTPAFFYGGQGICKLQFLIKKYILKNFWAVNFFKFVVIKTLDPDRGSGINESGSETLLSSSYSYCTKSYKTVPVLMSS